MVHFVAALLQLVHRGRCQAGVATLQ